MNLPTWLVRRARGLVEMTVIVPHHDEHAALKFGLRAFERTPRNHVYGAGQRCALRLRRGRLDNLHPRNIVNRNKVQGDSSTSAANPCAREIEASHRYRHIATGHAVDHDVACVTTAIVDGN